MFDYICNLDRMTRTGNKSDDGHDELELMPVYSKLVCSRPSQRVENITDDTIQVSTTEFTMRVPRAADVQIGDTVEDVRTLDQVVFFERATITNLLVNRTHIEVIMERR